MSDTPFVDRITLSQVKDSGYSWRGALPLSQLPRLGAELFEVQPQHELWLSVDLSSVRVGVYWLTLRVRGQLPLQCQRCLEGLEFSLALDNRLAVLSSESLLDLIDEGDDFVLCDEIAVAQGQDTQSISLLQVIEDECLLALPSSPKHDDCEAMLTQAGDIQEVIPDSPFAALARLKK